ncbi:MAG: Lipoteichoic acid synthase 1 [Bacteroidota bacterium]|jgi:phosphoglycerol transferase MdoB-like AlkP superfamily enzyme
MLFAISRVVFLAINHSSFKDLSVWSFFKISVYALRYDLSAIMALNVLYFIAGILFFYIKPNWFKYAFYFFVGINSIAFAFEFSDWIYFQFNFKRATADVLLFFTRKGDSLSILPGLFKVYWYLLVAYIAIINVFYRLNKNWTKAIEPVAYTSVYQKTIGIVFHIVWISGIALIAIRGGLQYVPIGVRNAVQVVANKEVPLVINTPFSILTTLQNQFLETPNYTDITSARAQVNTLKNFSAASFQKKNVVLIILESYSKEFTSLGKAQSFTPFLDSLLHQGLICNHAFANGLHSAEGIPAVLSGIPSLMDEAISVSPYSTNTMPSFANLLAPYGYSSYFFHGGTNGTMSFDVYTAAAGFQKYFGRTEYNNEADYDGNWGIWDAPFLQRVVTELNKAKEPFVSGIFTLSSHPPYAIPEDLKNKLPVGSLPAHQAVAYTDYALRQFFKVAAKQSWYANTLFVITADHTSPLSVDPYYRSEIGQYSIPILYYAPNDADLKGAYTSVTQQIDILPSVLDYLHYPKPFYALGNSIFHPSHPFAISYFNQQYVWIENDFVLKWIQERDLYIFNKSKDSICLNPIQQSQKDNHLRHLQSFIQVYRNDLNKNAMK